MKTFFLIQGLILTAGGYASKCSGGQFGTLLSCAGILCTVAGLGLLISEIMTAHRRNK